MPSVEKRLNLLSSLHKILLQSPIDQSTRGAWVTTLSVRQHGSSASSTMSLQDDSPHPSMEFTGSRVHLRNCVMHLVCRFMCNSIVIIFVPVAELSGERLPFSMPETMHLLNFKKIYVNLGREVFPSPLGHNLNTASVLVSGEIAGHSRFEISAPARHSLVDLLAWIDALSCMNSNLRFFA